MTTLNWYMVNRDGMATLCTDRADAEKEAADAQSVWPHMGPHRAVQLVEAADVEAMRAGYAAARLDIESLQARIKTMAEEHADELMVAHLDGRMRAGQPAGAQQPAKSESLRQILLDPENQPNQYGVQFLMHGAKMAFRIGNRQFCLDYEPDEPGEFEFMRDALISAFSIFTPDVKLAQQPSPTPQADSQPAPVQDMAVMQLAESVGLIGPASRTHDLHAAVQRFHDLICANATIKAAQMAAEAISEAAPQQEAQYNHGPQAETVAEAARDVGKWLNERPNRPIDLRHVAMLCAHAPALAADSVLEDAAQVEIDLFNDLNRIYGNTLTAYAKEMCRLGYRKTNAARKQGETSEH